MIVLRDGEPHPSPLVDVDVTSPMWLAGQSLFETMRVRRAGVTGIFCLDEHVQRLVTSAARLGWQGCPPAVRLREWVQRASLAFRQTSSDEGRLRLTVAWTRPRGEPVSLVVVTGYAPVERPAAIVSTRIAIPRTGDLAAKVGSRFVYVAAQVWAERQGADEAILVDHEGLPVEGARSNLFIALEDHIATPPLDRGPLGGIARRTVIAVLEKAGYRVVERPVTWDEVRAGAPFLTNALWGVRAVSAVDGEPCRGPGWIIQHARELFERAVNEALAAERACSERKGDLL